MSEKKTINDLIKAHIKNKDAEERYLTTSHMHAEQAAKSLHVAMQMENVISIGDKLFNVKDGSVALVTGRSAVGVAEDGSIIVSYQARRKLKDGSFSERSTNIARGDWKREHSDDIIISL